jgi:hypothetical protein
MENLGRFGSVVSKNKNTPLTMLTGNLIKIANPLSSWTNEYIGHENDEYTVMIVKKLIDTIMIINLLVVKT